MILVLDWAAKFSAGIVMDRSGTVRYQFDSWGKQNLEYCEEVAAVAASYEVSWVVVEDVPHGIKNLSQTKPVVRTHGVLARELDAVGLLDQTRFLQPSVWQRAFPGVWKGGPKGAKAAAETLGYAAPDLLEIYAESIPVKAPDNTKARADIRAKLRKAMTDYNDAFLIGRWTLEQSEEELLEKTQPYFPY